MLQNERNREPWENILSYYFLRYPELNEMFTKMMSNQFDYDLDSDPDFDSEFE